MYFQQMLLPFETLRSFWDPSQIWSEVRTFTPLFCSVCCLPVHSSEHFSLTSTWGLVDCLWWHLEPFLGTLSPRKNQNLPNSSKEACCESRNDGAWQRKGPPDLWARRAEMELSVPSAFIQLCKTTRHQSFSVDFFPRKGFWYTLATTQKVKTS